MNLESRQENEIMTASEYTSSVNDIKELLKKIKDIDLSKDE